MHVQDQPVGLISRLFQVEFQKVSSCRCAQARSQEIFRLAFGLCVLWFSFARWGALEDQYKLSSGWRRVKEPLAERAFLVGFMKFGEFAADAQVSFGWGVLRQKANGVKDLVRGFEKDAGNSLLEQFEQEVAAFALFIRWKSGEVKSTGRLAGYAQCRSQGAGPGQALDADPLGVALIDQFPPGIGNARSSGVANESAGCALLDLLEEFVLGGIG